jgi:hypothetical protein
MALAEDGSGATPDEAAVAVAKAQAIMLRYNLELAQVQAASGQKSNYTEERVEMGKTIGGYLAPLRHLYTALARANFCDVVIETRQPTGFVIGEPHNVAAVREMFARLSPELLNMANAAWSREWSGERLHRAKGYEGIALARKAMSWKRAYLFGAVATINDRLKAERERAKAEAAQGEQVRALVLVKDTELAEAMERMHPQAKPGKRATVRDASAFEAGARDGHGVELGRRGKLAAGAVALEAGEGEGE